MTRGSWAGRRRRRRSRSGSGRSRSSPGTAHPRAASCQWMAMGRRESRRQLGCRSRCGRHFGSRPANARATSNCTQMKQGTNRASVDAGSLVAGPAVHLLGDAAATLPVAVLVVFAYGRVLAIAPASEPQRPLGFKIVINSLLSMEACRLPETRLKALCVVGRGVLVVMGTAV